MNVEQDESTPESAAEPAPPALRAWASRHGLTALIVLSLLAPLWLIHPLPLQDLPLHEQSAALIANGPEWSGQAQHLSVDWTPRPYFVFQQLWGALAWAVGIDLASKLILTYVVVGGFLSGVVFVRRLDPRKHTRALLVGLLAFSEFYFAGWVPLIAGLPTGLWLLSRRMPDPGGGTWKRDVADAALLLATYLCHPVVGFLFGLVLIPVCARSKQPVRALARLVLIGLPCLLWTVGIALFGQERVLWPNDPAYWAPVWHTVLSLLCYPTAPYGWFLFWPLGGPARTCALLSILAWAIAAASLWPRGERVPSEGVPGLGLSLLLLLVFLFGFPDTWRNGATLSVRALLLFFPLLLAWLPTRGEDRRTRVLTVGAVLLSSSIAFAAHVIAEREARPLHAITAQLEPRANVLPPLPIDMHSRVLRGRFVEPHLNIVARYHSRRGGLGPMGAIYGTTTVWVSDKLPPVPDPRIYRYVLLPRGALPRPPRGFVELTLGDRDWQVYERR